jgi:high-affinity nickel-transport protein
MFFNVFDDRTDRVKTKSALIVALLVAANVIVWIWALAAFAGRPSLLGTALIAYMFGLRHAFDADHIAAIDNSVRKLMQEGKQPIAVGFFFSLGHSTVVVLASVLVAATATAMQANLGVFHDIGVVIGTGISALFLLIIAAANIFILNGVWSAFLNARRGEKLVDRELDKLLAGGGLLTRLFRRTFRVVSRSWHLYPVGFLFGLGFDTATEIGLLGISAAQTTQGLSFWSILTFPALFTVAMSLMDTGDSMLMTRAYGWSLVDPLRKLWYNLTITATSVVVAVFVGGLEALGLIADKLGLEGGVWSTLGGFSDNLANFGFALVAILIASWLLSMSIYRAVGLRQAGTGQS